MGFGFLTIDDLSSLPEDVQVTLEKDKAEAKEKALEKGKEPTDDTLIYFSKPDVDPELFPMYKDDAVSFEIYMDDKGCGAFNIKSADTDVSLEERKEQRRAEIVAKKGEKGKGKGGKSRVKGKDKERVKGASKGKRGSAHCHRIELEETDASFPFRTKLVGDGGANLK